VKDIFARPATAADINEALKQLDEIIRPKALVLNPQLKAAIMKEYPDIEKKVLLIETPACEAETAYLMDRKEVEMFIRGAEGGLTWTGSSV
jgi:hypothetical protein